MKLPEINITVSIDKAKKSELYKINSSGDADKVFRMIFDADKIDWIEESIIICLNRANKVVGYYKVSSGGTSGTVIDQKVIFTVALNCLASAIIIAHNHPSGQLIPSDADKKVTRQLQDGGKILGIDVLDHLILTDEGYFSFADDGLM